MLYNIKHIHLHCVFHGIRFKVNKDWVSGIDTLLFLYTFFFYIPFLPLLWCIFRIFIHKKIFHPLVFLTPSLYFCMVMSIVRLVNFKKPNKKTMNIKLRLIIMNFLQFAVWGSYLTSMGIWSMSTLPNTSASSMPCKASCHSSCQPLWVS